MERFIKAFLSLDSLLKPANAAAAVTGGTVGAFVVENMLPSGKFWAYLLLVLVIGGDWITGSQVAKRSGTHTSEYGTAGVFRTILLLWIPFIGWCLDQVSLHVFHITQPGVAFYALTLMLAYYSWESLTANAYLAGWEKWIPRSVADFISSEIRAKKDRILKMQQRSTNSDDKIA